MKKTLGIVGLCLVLLGVASLCSCKDGKSEADLRMGAAGVAALTDSYIENCLKTLEIMAIIDEVGSGDWDTMLPVLTKADDVMLPGPTWFALPDGSYYVVGMGKTDKNISDRAYFSVVMSGSNTYSELVVSRSTGEKALVTAVPVFEDEKVIGVLGVSVFLEDLSNTISEQLSLSDDIVFYALTAANQVALHTDTEMILGEKPEPMKNSVSHLAPFTGWQITLGYNN
jgi:methyl-accepting chemotaxis protein